ncbi:MAG TPA: hypothetical protein VF752_01790 [Thermoleophilaceae bacterium]
MAKIALDIDSTLHHYWDVFDAIVQRRFGVELPYEEQTDWGIALLERDQLIACVEETHSVENIMGAKPYPHAVETVRAWHDAGHFIHVTSHRAESAREATEGWLDEIGLPYDDLHCSYDKVSRCVELEIAVLVDDSPVNIQRALEVGIVPATLIHPWNAHLADDERVIVSEDWRALRDRVAPLLSSIDAEEPAPS